MLLTTCAVCGAEVAKKLCGRCGTHYCSPRCQEEHWASGHKKKCKRMERAGGAEQYYANEKAAESALAAIDACAASIPVRAPERRSALEPGRVDAAGGTEMSAVEDLRRRLVA